MSQFDWQELHDANGNAYYEALSPYEDILWRLRQRLVGGKIVWYEDHDYELMSFDDGAEEWPTLNEAKAAIVEAHNGILKSGEYTT